jgi:hypothetical protein
MPELAGFFFKKYCKLSIDRLKLLPVQNKISPPSDPAILFGVKLNVAGGLYSHFSN